MNPITESKNNENFQKLQKKIQEKKPLPQLKIPTSKEMNSLKGMMSNFFSAQFLKFLGL